MNQKPAGPRAVSLHAYKPDSTSPQKLLPEMLPEPWLFNSEVLLEELDRIREMILCIPPHTQTLTAINNAIDAVWNLRETLRYLLYLHREGQRSFARKAERLEQARQNIIKERKMKLPLSEADVRFVEQMISILPKTRHL
jgi:hypothetical protein